MNAVRSARSRRTSVWLGTLTGVLVLAAAPVVATAVGVGPAGAVARSSGTQRVFVSPQGHTGAAGTRIDPVASSLGEGDSTQRGQITSFVPSRLSFSASISSWTA